MRLATEDGMMPRFENAQWYEAAGQRMAGVKLDLETDDFAHLIGHTVEIDGERYRVKAVERFLHMPPWRAGEGVGLAVEATT